MNLQNQKIKNQQDLKSVNWCKSKWNFIMMCVFIVGGTTLFAVIDATLGGFLAGGFAVAGWFVGNPIGNSKQKQLLYNKAYQIAKSKNMTIFQYAISTLNVEQLDKLRMYNGPAYNVYVNDFFNDGYISIYQRFVLNEYKIAAEDIKKRIDEITNSEITNSEIESDNAVNKQKVSL